jgi:hypothetical protein
MPENADEEYIPAELKSITHEIGEDGVRDDPATPCLTSLSLPQSGVT